MRTVEELWREAEDIRMSVPEVVDLTNESHTSFLHVLRNLYKSIILTNLDFALDKKIEQDLWNVCFKIPISGLQPARGKKNTNPLFNWFLEGSSGFYMILLQEICAQCDIDSTICKRNVQLAIFSGPTYAVKPKSESFLYICQHCLIHLGDLARYRNLLGEAEGYYKQAIRVEPSSGHPYNQLALLESARGDTLSTLFYYVRSLALRHPFPPARINLEKLRKKQWAQLSPKPRGGRLSADEFLICFLKIQGQIGLNCDFDQAEQKVNLLNLTWPSLVATEAFSPTQLIRMLTITVFTVGECSGSSATDAQKRSLQLAIDLAASILNACLTACCSLPDNEQLLPTCKYLAVIKLVLDWFRTQPEVLAKIKRGQLWSSTAKLLNQLRIYSAGSDDDDGLPLPEDLELLEFSPIRPVKRWTAMQLTDTEHRTRANRIVLQGKWLAEQNFGCLTVNEQFVFSSASPDSPLATTNKTIATEEPTAPKEIKILARPPQRNVALTAILKHSKVDEEEEPQHNKQVSFQHVLAPPLPPVKPSTSNYPRPSLPPRLERLKEQKERDQISNYGGMYSSFGAALPDLSHPPPPVPPPGLGFPPPPASWALPGPPPSVPPYSLFNSTPWQQPTVGHLPNFSANLPEQQRPSSLWSGPGPSPLERLLEQQKATRTGGTSPSKK